MLENMPWISLFVGLCLLAFGADFLVRGGSRLALRLGMSPLLVGLTIIALGTSSPELLVSLNAALSGKSALALGNAVGSNIANLGLILGFAAILAPLRLRKEVLKRDLPVMILATVITVIAAANNFISRGEGFFLIAVLFAYLVFTYRQQKGSCDEVGGCSTGSVWKNVALLIVGCFGLAFGSDMMVTGAVTIAKGWNISDAVIGMTVVAIGTSLPELAASTAAVLKGETDLAIGNVVGSNIFNCLAILGITASVSPIDAVGFSSHQLIFMLALTIFALPVMLSGARVCRVEGVMLLSAYVGYSVFLFV